MTQLLRAPPILVLHIERGAVSYRELLHAERDDVQRILRDISLEVTCRSRFGGGAAQALSATSGRSRGRRELGRKALKLGLEVPRTQHPLSCRSSTSKKSTQTTIGGTSIPQFIREKRARAEAAKANVEQRVAKKQQAERARTDGPGAAGAEGAGTTWPGGVPRGARAPQHHQRSRAVVGRPSSVERWS